MGAGMPESDDTGQAAEPTSRLGSSAAGQAAGGSATAGDPAESVGASASAQSGSRWRALPLRPMRRWHAYRERQLELLAESNRLQREQTEAARQPAPGPSPAQAGDPGVAGPPEPSAEMTAAARRAAGVHISSPFFIGFVGALGVLTAYLLVTNLARLTMVFTVVIVALFLTLVLNPIVEAFVRHGAPRGFSVGAVFLGLLGVVAFLGFLVIPPVVSEIGIFVERAPRYVQELNDRPWFADLDEQYNITTRLEEEVENRLSDTAFISTVFGGVLGAAGWIAAGTVGVFSTLILTLYFLAAFPNVKDAAYKIVPASRRPRVIALAEEMMRRVGGYALGQILVASINAFCSWIMMMILNIPYAIVLAVVVGILGLIPLVGATLGAVIVALVALFQTPTLALVVIGYFLIYQQVENYLVVPKVMQRTVSVPGAVTVVAVLAGGTMLGVMGALLAIPVAAGLLLLYEEVVVPRQSKL